jgi:hypothetical protein
MSQQLSWDFGDDHDWLSIFHDIERRVFERKQCHRRPNKYREQKQNFIEQLKNRYEALSYGRRFMIYWTQHFGYYQCMNLLYYRSTLGCVHCNVPEIPSMRNLCINAVENNTNDKKLSTEIFSLWFILCNPDNRYHTIDTLLCAETKERAVFIGEALVSIMSRPITEVICRYVDWM